MAIAVRVPSVNEERWRGLERVRVIPSDILLINHRTLRVTTQHDQAFSNQPVRARFARRCGKKVCKLTYPQAAEIFWTRFPLLAPSSIVVFVHSYLNEIGGRIVG